MISPFVLFRVVERGYGVDVPKEECYLFGSVHKMPFLIILISLLP